MSFTHTGGWLTGPCADPSVWVGVVNGDCFLEITASDFDLSTGTVTAPVPDASMTPSGGAADAGPWFIDIGTGASATYAFSFPGLTRPRDLTVRATPWLPPTLVGSSVTGLNQTATSFSVSPHSSGTIGTIQLFHLNSRDNSATTIGSMPGWTFLGSQTDSFSGQVSNDEWWWRLSDTSNAAGTLAHGAGGPNYTLGIYDIDNVQSPYLSSPIAFDTNSGSTGTLTTTATDIGAWLTYDRTFFGGENLTHVAVHPVNVFAGAASITVTKGTAGEGTLSGLVLPAVTITPVDLTAALTACGGWRVGRVGFGSGNTW